VPLFWVVRLPSASSLTQQQLRSEYLVVGHPVSETEQPRIDAQRIRHQTRAGMIALRFVEC
jgi:hypothetical protein